VNIGSMGGKVTFPGGGLYHATKYALEAISDALRFEVRGFGVDVVLVEPGFISTRYVNTAQAAIPAERGPYHDFNRAVHEVMEWTYGGGLRRLGGGPDVVADRIARLLGERHPRARYPVTPSARIAITLRQLTPDRIWDLLMRARYPTPRP
jgi:NAD(P)-dependent dehydrogenase (short-subunit alcohol dehydrogenase family)